jgi:hypothetical protein
MKAGAVLLATGFVLTAVASGVVLLGHMWPEGITVLWFSAFFFGRASGYYE